MREIKFANDIIDYSSHIKLPLYEFLHSHTLIFIIVVEIHTSTLKAMLKIQFEEKRGRFEIQAWRQHLEQVRALQVSGVSFHCSREGREGGIMINASAIVFEMHCLSFKSALGKMGNKQWEHPSTMVNWLLSLLVTKSG